MPLLANASALEQKADALAEKLEQLEEWRPEWGTAFFQALEAAARSEREAERERDEDGEDLGLATDSGQALFHRVDASALGGGLESLAALDESRSETPRLHEYVWWFLGAVLVLGGSLMGVREAWRALGGVPRQLLVSGALFAYHAGFIGLGVFLARRSASAGRVLASIGLALLPVVFVALSALMELTPMVGLPVSAVAAGLGLLTLRPAGRLLYGASTVSLGVALLPSLLAGLPLMGLEDAPGPRTLCAFAGVAAFGAATWRAQREARSEAGLAVLTTSLYGALALAVFSVTSAPSGFEALALGSPMFAGMVLWAVALAATVAGVATQPLAREAHPQAAPVVETLAHAVVAAGALAGAVSGFTVVLGDAPWVDLASALAPVAAALAFFLLEPRRQALLHPGVLATTLAGVLLARLVMPAEPQAWMVGIAAVGAGLLLVARENEPTRRFWLLGWGTVLSLASLALTSGILTVWDTQPGWAAVAAGTLVAVASHVAGGYRLRGLHYLGGIAVVSGALGAVSVWEGSVTPWMGVAVLTGVAGLYAVAGLFQSAWMHRAGKVNELLPLDDLSLALATLGVLRAHERVTSEFIEGELLPSWLSTGVLLLDAVLGALPFVLVSVLLLLRVRRDHSRLVSALGAWGLALAFVHFCRMASTLFVGFGTRVMLLAALVLAYCAIAALRERKPEEYTPVGRGRRLLGWFRLPFPERGRALYTDGFAAVAFAVAGIVLLLLVGWMSAPNEVDRSHVVLAGGLLTGSALLAFVSRGFVTWHLRGSVGTLAAVGLFITLSAVLNRLGRPLPPDVVALRLPLIGIAIWLLALATRRFGPGLGRLLENERHGRVYHFVPHAGVAALGVVLAVEAWVVGGPHLSRALTVVPPLMPLGAALLALLLAFSFRAPALVHLGLLLGLPGAALWAVHRTVLGHALVALDSPGGRWVRAETLEATRELFWLNPGAWLPAGESIPDLWYRAFVGIAAAGLVYAGARFVPSEVSSGALKRWSGTAAWLVFAAAFFQPGLEAAGLTLASGVLLLVSGARTQGRLVPGIGLLLLVHALAHREPTVGSWPGPVLALLGLLLVALSPWVARWRGREESRGRAPAQLGALFYALVAAVYALAAGGGTDPVIAVPCLLFEALKGFSGLWMRSAALPVTSALVAATLLMGAYQWKGALSKVGAQWATTLAGIAAVSGLAVGLVLGTPGLREAPSYEALLSLHGAALALCVAGVAALAHVASQGIRGGREDVARGLAWSRDLWLIMTGALLALVAVLVREPDERMLPLAGAAIGLAVVVSLHCAWREQTGRHVYFVQVAVVGVYALVRALYAQGLRPEHDALFALALGFVLVGVTVLARRAGIPPVEQATRRFAALLPVGMALVLPSEATGEAALLAGGSGLLYASLGAVAHSRLFGSLAATACNVALLIGALSMNMEGLEVYLAPLGLLLLMLGQLFTSSLPRVARNAVRIVGGLLLYVPAAAKLTLQMGQAEDGTYALVFGAACLFGVVAGMALHIRAYLALGTLFLTLDVASTLVHAGLRDHRIGFVVMTLTGLTIVGGRVLATLRRQELDLLVRRVRVTLRGWD